MGCEPGSCVVVFLLPEGCAAQGLLQEVAVRSCPPVVSLGW